MYCTPFPIEELPISKTKEKPEDDKKKPDPEESENDSVMEGIAVFALSVKHRITGSMVFNAIDILLWLPYIIYVTCRDAGKEAIWVEEEHRRTAEICARGNNPVKAISEGSNHV